MQAPALEAEAFFFTTDTLTYQLNFRSCQWFSCQALWGVGETQDKTELKLKRVFVYPPTCSVTPYRTSISDLGSAECKFSSPTSVNAKSTQGQRANTRKSKSPLWHSFGEGLLALGPIWPFPIHAISGYGVRNREVVTWTIRYRALGVRLSDEC